MKICDCGDFLSTGEYHRGFDCTCDMLRAGSLLAFVADISIVNVARRDGTVGVHNAVVVGWPFGDLSADLPISVIGIGDPKHMYGSRTVTTCSNFSSFNQKCSLIPEYTIPP